MSWKSVAAAAVLVLAAHTAVADESGTFQMLRSYQHSYITVDHGSRSFTGGILRGTNTITSSSGGPFVEGAHSRSECLVFSRSSDGGISLEAPCVNVDDDGDRLYSVARRDQGTIGAGGGGGGRWELHGGTGKYAAVTGRCTYQTQYLDDGWLVATGYLRVEQGRKHVGAYVPPDVSRAGRATSRRRPVTVCHGVGIAQIRTLSALYAAAPCSRSRAWWTWWAPWRVHWPPVRVRCPVALSLSATFAHERPARRCSMIAASVSCSPWSHARRPSMNWNP